VSISMQCDLCGTEVEDVNNIMVELQHWLIIRNPQNMHGEEHFCRKCTPEQEALITKQREEVAQRQDNE